MRTVPLSLSLSVLLAALLAACAPTPSAKLPEVASEPPPEIALTGVTFRAFRGDVLDATGSAVAATYRTPTGAGAAERPRVVLHQEREGRAIRVEAGRGAGNSRMLIAEASEGLELLMPDGAVATTESGQLDGNTRIARGAAPVDVVGPTYHAHAKAGFEFHLNPPVSLEFEGPVETLLTGDAP